MMHNFLRAGCLASLLMLAACSDDPASNNEADTLTQDAIEDLVQTLGEQALAPIFRDAGAGKSTVEIPIDETQACPGGGTNQVVGSLSGESESGAGILAMNLDDILTSCALDLDGQSYVVDTEPVLALTGTVVVAQGAFQETQTMVMGGPLSLKPSRGPTLTCPIDLSFSVTLSTRSARVTGTACGVAVDVPLTFEA
jgi:hypothetical protein